MRSADRRDFLRAALGGAAAASVGLRTAVAAPQSPRAIAPPRRIPAPGDPFTQLGYAAITWGGNDEQAIDDIAAVGFHGIQLRSPILEKYGDRPAELKRRLDDKGLTLMCLSSGSLDADPARRAEYLDTHTKNARFVGALNGSVLQVISRRPKDRAPTPAEFESLGALLSDLGRRTREVGVSLVYHNHMHAFGESPEEVARVMDLTDPKAVWLLFDIAHYTQAGGDPVKGIARHKDRIAFVHLKDVVSPLEDGKPPRESYRFVELGRGHVDVKGSLAALVAAGLRRPGVIELDTVEAGTTPKQAAEANKQYAVGVLGLHV
jgi:inosose dehydratase